MSHPTDVAHHHVSLYNVLCCCAHLQVSLGAEISVAAGPIGRSASAAGTVNLDIAMAPILSYSHSKGLFAGVSLEGAIIASRPDVNRAFYGRDVSARSILSGEILPPPAAKPLYDALLDIKAFT